MPTMERVMPAAPTASRRSKPSSPASIDFNNQSNDLPGHQVTIASRVAGRHSCQDHGDSRHHHGSSREVGFDDETTEDYKERLSNNLVALLLRSSMFFKHSAYQNEESTASCSLTMRDHSLT